MKDEGKWRPNSLPGMVFSNQTIISEYLSGCVVTGAMIRMAEDNLANGMARGILSNSKFSTSRKDLGVTILRVDCVVLTTDELGEALRREYDRGYAAGQRG